MLLLITSNFSFSFFSPSASHPGDRRTRRPAGGNEHAIHFLEDEPRGSWQEWSGEAEVSGLCTQASLRAAEGTVGVRWEASPAQTHVLWKQSLSRLGMVASGRTLRPTELGEESLRDDILSFHPREEPGPSPGGVGVGGPRQSHG